MTTLGVAEITNFDQHQGLIANNDRVVIFLGSERCGHCRTMVPVVQKFARQYPNVAFGHVEITKVKTENVGPVPVFVGYRDHNPVDVVLGADNEALQGMITKKLL